MMRQMLLRRARPAGGKHKAAAVVHVSRRPWVVRVGKELSCQAPRLMDNPMRACTGSV